ncbi:MAG: hypothetical protein LBF89_02240 [Bacteroidales bacterium]|jgi:TonB-dependent SusC/RagA subfamily outer membrane receptor|nr:hypothetical protein [Bacteroidales bacterium]
MKDFFIYLLKVNVLLIFFYLIYLLFLRRDTFYVHHRWYLLSSMLSALFLPLLHPNTWFAEREMAIVQDIPSVEDFYQLFLLPSTPVQPSLAGHPIETLPAITLSGIALFLLAKRLRQLFRITGMAFRASKHICGTQPVLVVRDPVQPFSFFKWIFLPFHLFRQAVAGEIIAHEQIHCRKWHSVDVLLSEAVVCCCWYNPIAWMLRSELRQNIEFYTDRQMLALGFDRKLYQYHLLQISGNISDCFIVNHFYFNHLKKRIIMMNKKNSPRLLSVKYALSIPLMFTAVWLVCASGVEAAITQSGSDAFVEYADHPPVPLAMLPVVLPDIAKPHSTRTIAFVDSHKYVTCDVDQPHFYVVPFSDSAKVAKAVRKMAFAQDDPQTSGARMNVKPDTIVIVGFDNPKNESVVNQLNENALVFIDGKESTVDEMKKQDPNTIESVTVMKDRAAVSVYGEKGKNGVIVIKLKHPARATLIDSTAAGKRTVTMVVGSLRDSELTVRSAEGALVFIDGKESTEDEMKKLDPNTIESVTIMKNEAAVSVYGEKGKNGVIVVKLKHPARTTLIDSTATGKHTVTMMTGYSRDFSELIVRSTEDALVFIDGQESTVDEMKKLDTNTIKSFGILKDEAAVSVYGEKGRNGVVFIKLKDPAKNIPDDHTQQSNDK